MTFDSNGLSEITDQCGHLVQYLMSIIYRISFLNFHANILTVSYVALHMRMNHIFENSLDY